MPDALDTFFAASAARPWKWSRVDCAMTLADWAIYNGHPDPFADYRGAYDSEAAFRALVVARGGTLPIISVLLSRTRIAPGDASLSAKDGATLVAWKNKETLGWQLYDTKGQPQGNPGAVSSAGNGAGGVVLPNGKFVLFP